MNARWQASLAALLGLALMLWLAWPGFFTYDSAFQLAQARGLMPVDDANPPLMAMVWRGLDRLWAYPGALFALISVGYWFALAALVWRLFERTAWRWSVFALLALWPPLFVTMCHVWKDCAMTAALLAACACIANRRRGGGLAWTLVALFWLAIACCLRYNAITSVAPLVLWLCWPRAAQPRARTYTTACMATVAVSLLLLMVPPMFARAVGATPRHAWVAIALWDVAGVSIRENQMLIPPRLLNRPTTVADLAHDYTPVTNVNTFLPGRIKLSYDHDYTPDDVAAAWDAWTGAIVHHPRAYLAHRLAFSRWQYLGYDSSTPKGLAFSPNRYDQSFIKLGLPPVDPHAPWLRMLEWMRTTPWFAGIWYVLIASIAAAIAWRRRALRDPVPALALALSGLGNALPLAIISGSCDFRYLIWTVLTALIALPLSLAPAGGERA
jgi:hypothetical protein